MSWSGLVTQTTCPEISRVSQVPQLPDRQPASTPIKWRSAKSSRFASCPSQSSVRPDRRNPMVPAGPGAAGIGTTDIALGAAVCGPKDSRWMSASASAAPQPAKGRDQCLHHRIGAADVEGMTAVRQRLFQQIEADETRFVIVLPQHIARRGIGIDNVQIEPRIRPCQRFQDRLEGVIPPVSHTVKQVRHKVRFCGKGRFQHRQDRRDADAACDEHRRDTVILREDKLPGCSPDLQNRPDLRLIVQPARGDPGRLARGHRPLDRGAKAGGIRGCLTANSRAPPVQVRPRPPQPARVSGIAPAGTAAMRLRQALPRRTSTGHLPHPHKHG